MDKFDINYQNYDLIFKDAFTLFKDQALNFLNSDLNTCLMVMREL